MNVKESKKIIKFEYLVGYGKKKEVDILMSKKGNSSVEKLKETIAKLKESEEKSKK